MIKIKLNWLCKIIFVEIDIEKKIYHWKLKFLLSYFLEKIKDLLNWKLLLYIQIWNIVYLKHLFILELKFANENLFLKLKTNKGKII